MEWVGPQSELGKQRGGGKKRVERWLGCEGERGFWKSRAVPRVAAALLEVRLSYKQAKLTLTSWPWLLVGKSRRFSQGLFPRAGAPDGFGGLASGRRGIPPENRKCETRSSICS